MRLDGAEQLARTLLDVDLVLAPRIFVAETANALWKYCRTGEMQTDAALKCHQECLSLVDEFIDDEELATEALILARALDHPVYDSLYLVLARRHGGSVCTLDRRMQGLASRLDVPVSVTSVS